MELEHFRHTDTEHWSHEDGFEEDEGKQTGF